MTIKYKVRDRVLLLPDDHLLPVYQKDHPTYDMMFDPIYKAVGACAPARYFVDVGANVGDTAVVMRHNATNPILCIEGYSRFLVYLRENIEGLPDVRIVPAFIGTDEVSGPLAYSSQGGTGRLEVVPEPEKEPEPRTRSLQSILEEEGALQSGVALLKTDTDGMDAFILQQFLKLGQSDAALFFECDVRQTLLGERGYATWRSVFGTLRARGYSLVIFDNFGLRIASCTPNRYDLVWELIAYVDAQFSHESVHVYYLDIWAFPPAMAMIFERCCTHAFASSQPPVEFDIQRQRRAPVVPPSGWTNDYDRSKWYASWKKIEEQIVGGGSLEDWSHCRAQISDLRVDLARANKTIQEQRRVINLLSANLAELKQKPNQDQKPSQNDAQPSHTGSRPTGFWRILKK